MTASDWLSGFNVLWNLVQIGILISLMRIGWTVQFQMDEVLQILREIRADQQESHPIMNRANVTEQPRWDTTAAGNGHLERKDRESKG